MVRDTIESSVDSASTRQVPRHRKMPSVCEAIGVRFEYPDNWSLDGGEGGDSAGPVTVAGPESAIWQLSRYSLETDLEPLFDEALAALRAEYGDIEVSPASQVVEGTALAGYDVNFFYLDLTSTVQLRGFQHGDASYFLFCQAEDREFDRVAPVFQAMLTSLLRGQGARRR